MALDAGIIVPDNDVVHSFNHIKRTLVADAGLSPTNLVKFDTSKSLIIVCGASDEECIGVAGRNEKAWARSHTDPMTTAFVDGDQVPVHMDGLLVVVADAGAITRGHLVEVGGTDGAEAEDIVAATYTACIIGRAMSSGASTEKAVVRFF